MATPSSSNESLGRPCHINCLQGNMRRSKPSLLNLILDSANKKIHPKGVDIMFITEPPRIMTTNKLSKVPATTYNVFAEKSGRAALITKGITSWRCPQYCAKDIIVCQAKFNDCLTYLVSMYLDCTVLGFPPEFTELIWKKGECDIIIGADSNAHSTIWNCPKTDKKGEFIEDFLIANDLLCLNVGNRPTFENAQGNTLIIDITIANYNLATSVCNWKVDNYLNISDHYRISFSINNCPNFRVAETLDWNYKKGDWVLFKKELDLGLQKWSNARHWSLTLSMLNQFGYTLSCGQLYITHSYPPWPGLQVYLEWLYTYFPTYFGLILGLHPWVNPRICHDIPRLSGGVLQYDTIQLNTIKYNTGGWNVSNPFVIGISCWCLLWWTISSMAVH